MKQNQFGHVRMGSQRAPICFSLPNNDYVGILISRTWYSSDTNLVIERTRHDIKIQYCIPPALYIMHSTSHN